MASSGYELISQSLPKLPPIGGLSKGTPFNPSSSKNTAAIDAGNSKNEKAATRPSTTMSDSVVSSSHSISNTTAEPSKDIPDTVESSIEEDWERQMKILEEVDILTAKGNAFIPEPLKAPLVKHIERFPGLKRVPIYKLMEDYGWKLEILELLLAIFDAASAETHLPMVDFLNSLTPLHLHQLGLELFHKLISQPALINEFVVQVPRSEGHYLMQIARHLPQFEFQVMADNLLSLSSVNDMLQYLHYLEANRQTSKHCALCRQKRLYNLQYRMCNGQVPKDTLSIPGVLPLYDRAEIWSADDERHYTYDTTTGVGQIFWQKMPVNLVEICDNCVMEVHKAVTNQGRHDSIYHLPAEQRKPAMRQARDAEQDLAQIIMLIAKERKMRRLREFGLSALHLQGLGLQKETESRRLQAEEAQRQAILAEEAEKRRILNEKALAVDEKWKQIDRRHDSEFLDTRNRFSLVQLHRGFNGNDRPVPKDRQHATTWRRQDFDADGLPITAEAANALFGIPVPQDHSHEKPMLDIWKKIADEKHALFKERERMKEEERRRIAQQNLQTLKDYIQERLTVLDRQQDQMKAMQEEEELRRQQQRIFDKQERRRLRFAAYLQEERYHMEVEDARSHALRAYVEEIQRENMERENMFNAECDQRELDRFWGVDYFEECLRAEEKRLRAFYQARVIQLNRELQKMGCVQPRRKKGDRETLVVPVEVRPIGSLPEERSFLDQAADKARQLYMIKKLKAEEIRSQLKYRLKFSYM